MKISFAAVRAFNHSCLFELEHLIVLDEMVLTGSLTDR